ncbi:hypothetical protein BJ508DRAFT_416888, partial [Ascobolus immersus RN42]
MSGTNPPKQQKHESRTATPTPSPKPPASSPSKINTESPSSPQYSWADRKITLTSTPPNESNWIRRDEHILPTPGSSQLPKDTWIDRGESLLPFDDGIDRLPRDTWIDKGVSLFGEDTWISRGETMFGEDDNWIARGESMLPKDSWVSQGKKLIPNHERVAIDGLQEVIELQARQEAEARSRSQTPRQAPTRLTNQKL